MASDINSTTIVGRLTRDIEMKYSTSGTAIGRFAIANTQSRKNGDQWVEETHFFDCVMFGKRADALKQYLNKGQQIVVLGTLQQNRWQDKETGANRSKVEILVNDIQLVGGKKDSGSSAGNGYGTSTTEQAPADDGFVDDIPF